MAKKHLKVFEDAVFMIKELHKRKFNLYTDSNNSFSGVLAKLIRAGLADRYGSKYFKKIYGGDFTCCSKATYMHFEKLLNAEKLKPSEVIVIGDSPEQDLAIPKKIEMVKGEDIIKEICIIKNGQVIYRYEGYNMEENIELEDKLKLEDGKMTFYYVRVKQEDGERAWSSPIWVIF